MTPKVINKTPRKVTFLDKDGEPLVTLPPSDTPATLPTPSTFDGFAKVGSEMIGISRTIYGEPSELPAPSADTLYLVSSLYRTHSSRTDLVSPGQLKRDADGNPVGCVGLIR